jgi:hypothetical protein
VLHPTFRVPFAKKGELSIGPALKYTKSDEDEKQFINEAKPYGVGPFGELGVHGALIWDGRDQAIFPARGSSRRRARHLLREDVGRRERFHLAVDGNSTPTSPPARS